MVNEWPHGESKTYQPILELEKGYHHVQIEYYGRSGPAGAQLTWEKID